MPIKTTLIAMVIAAAPTLGIGCEMHQQQTTAASCAQGMVWDSAKQQCVDQSTS